MTTDATATVDETLLSQSSTRDGVVTHSNLSDELARTVRTLAARGTVLLRNNNGVLPLTASEPLALFGRVQCDWIAVGYGSGGDVNAPYLTTLLDGLREHEVALDAELVDTYERWCTENPVDPGSEWGKWPLSFPEMQLSDDVVEAAAARARTAVVIVGRAAGEDRESVLEPGSFYLTDDERRLVEQTVRFFERTVAVVVTGNVIDLAWAEELGVDALVLAWCGGMEGGRAVADVLVGVQEPGGRLTDTIARSYESYPSAGHFGDLEANDYVEDIFVGYRYFETFAPEDVLYPFGFGLSYSKHEITSEGVELTEDGACVAVTALNTGERSSSTVVQVYVAKPTGPLTQPARELVGFGRTEELAPGEGEEQVLDIPWRDLASYDDSGVTGHRFAWVLPAGTYTFYVGADVRSAREAGTIDIDETMVLEQLEQAAAPEESFDRLVRQIDETGASVKAWEPVPLSNVDLRARILDRLPQPLSTTQSGGEQGESADAQDAPLHFDDVMSGRVSLQDFVASLSPRDLSCLTYGDIVMDSPLGAKGNAGALGGVTPQLRDLGVPPSTTTDGPSGIRLAATASLLPCGTALASTWDPDAVTDMATLHGEEMGVLGSDILLSPGMNIHRDPLCGRNFEYYSEDPLLTGLMASAVVSGIQSTGKAACPKHFAANNQETNRIFNDSRMSERALREIYLRGFEIVVTEAQPKVIMTSYNKVNGVWAHYHYDLVTTILRREWGFEGMVITDWWMRMAQDPNFPQLRDSAYRVRAGVDVLMPGGKTHFATERDDAVMDSYGLEDGLTLAEMQASAAHVLRFLMS